MNKLYIYFIGIGIFISLVFFGLYQYKCKVQLELELKTAMDTIQVQQLYISEKDKAIKDIEKKYRDKLANKPTDSCGDAIVSKEIKEWIQQ